MFRCSTSTFRSRLTTAAFAIHHLKELTSIHGFLRPETLVVVDDCMQTPITSLGKEDVIIARDSRSGRQGRLVAEYAKTVGATSNFPRITQDGSALTADADASSTNLGVLRPARIAQAARRHPIPG